MVTFLIGTSMFFSVIGLGLFFDPTNDRGYYEEFGKVQKAIGSAFMFFALVMFVIAGAMLIPFFECNR